MKKIEKTLINFIAVERKVLKVMDAPPHFFKLPQIQARLPELSRGRIENALKRLQESGMVERRTYSFARPKWFLLRPPLYLESVLRKHMRQARKYMLCNKSKGLLEIRGDRRDLAAIVEAIREVWEYDIQLSSRTKKLEKNGDV